MELLNFFMLQVCPTAGCVLASLMFCAPVRDLNHGLQRGSLGTLNPVPWAFAVGNTFGWLLYGFILKDVYVLAANLPGLFINLWLCHGAAKLQYFRRQKRSIAFDTALYSQQGSNDENSISRSVSTTNNFDFMLSMTPLEQVFFAISASWAILGAYTGWFMDRDHAANIIGVTANCNLVFFYMAPLNIIWKVIKTRNSASIHRPTLFLNTLNSSFWSFYGIARHDRIIIFPNAIGSLFGLVQIIVCILFPHLPVHDDDSDDEGKDINNYGLMEDQSSSA